MHSTDLCSIYSPVPNNSLPAYQFFFFLSDPTFISYQGCLYGGELARLGLLDRLGEMIFIPRSYGIFYLSSIKKFVKKIV